MPCLECCTDIASDVIEPMEASDFACEIYNHSEGIFRLQIFVEDDFAMQAFEVTVTPYNSGMLTACKMSGTTRVLIAMWHGWERCEHCHQFGAVNLHRIAAITIAHDEDTGRLGVTAEFKQLGVGACTFLLRFYQHCGESCSQDCPCSMACAANMGITLRRAPYFQRLQTKTAAALTHN